MPMRIEEISDTTPLEAFLALRHLPFPFLLSGGVTPSLRRYSYVGAAPSLRIETKSGHTESILSSQRVSFPTPFDALSTIMEEHTNGPESPFPFNGGFVGYLSYDLKSFIESIPYRAPDCGAADCFLGLYDPIFVYDHSELKGYVVSSGRKNATLNAANLKGILSSPSLKETLSTTNFHSDRGFTSNMTRQEYLSRLKRVKEYIAAGDIYQVNLSQRLSLEWSGDPFSLYSRLISITPAPFSSFMDFGPYQIISNSPERFLKVSGKQIETCPIKGTKARGKTDEEDRRMRESLRRDKKELAEHIMIIDLERNDLGKICETGSVTVEEAMRIETLPHLHHMVSTVKGRLRDEVTLSECLMACFPGGSITGAPKVRAMEIIDEIEPTPRGVYTGAIGYIDLSGNMDMAMAIRTAITTENRLQINVGGGIVADSVPEREYDETILKADSFLHLLTGDSVYRKEA
ncbi:MAG: aminodeoxychorismate synthase component I [Deltaproteobacteria bacterium]|nr:aminodeoxychorismate synthase component I [Deltaproteobacteria bacterium]